MSDAATIALSPVAVVTGATGGIGRWIARGIARAGFTVVAVGRNPERLADLRDWLAAEAPGSVVETELCDLSLASAAARAGEAIAARHRSVALLVNNAGIFTTRRRETAEGVEAVIATNHLGPFVLTRALAPALARHVDLAGGAAARVVNVGSVMSERVGIDAGDLELRRGWNAVRAYGRSKLALAIATRLWAERFGPGVVVNVVHPGAVATGIVRDGVLSGLAWRAMSPFLLTAEQGAAAPLRLALSPELAAATGRYLKRAGEARPNRAVGDPRIADAVWRATEALADRILAETAP